MGSQGASWVFRGSGTDYPVIDMHPSNRGYGWGQSMPGGSNRGANTSSIGRGPTYWRQVHGTQVWPAHRPRRSNVSRRSSA